MHKPRDVTLLYKQPICKTAHITTTIQPLRMFSSLVRPTIPIRPIRFLSPAVLYTTSSIMAQPSSLSSKYRMNSGYEIPAVGYGVSINVYTRNGM